MAIIGVPLFPVFLSKLNILTQLADYSLPLLFVVLLCFLVVAAAFAAILIRTIPQTSEVKHEHSNASISMKTADYNTVCRYYAAGSLFTGQPA